MIQIIEDIKEIEKIQGDFFNIITKILNIETKSSLGFQGGNFKTSLYHSSDYDFWYSFEKIDNRFWNGFGLGEPKENKNVSILCEINFPYFGIDRRIAGVLAKDYKGNVFVLHRGKIGGGRKGIGKGLFINNYRGKFIEIKDAGKQSIFALIGELYSVLFIEQLKTFISEIERIKNLSTSSQIIQETDELSEFSDEFTGIKTYLQNEFIQAECNHGLVVNSLSKLLEKYKYTTHNDRNRDLFLTRNGHVTHLFEVKTNTSLTNIYTAIGQLYYHRCNSNPLKIIVLPNPVSEKMIHKLKIIGIETLVYNFEDTKIKFINIEKIIG